MTVDTDETDGFEAKEILLANEEAKKDKEKASEDATDDDNEGVPTDSGFAWVIVLNAFIIMSVIIGFNRGLSVLFVDISEEFQEKATIVSLMFTLHSLSSSVASIIVSNIIMSKVSVRSICVVSSIGNSLVSIAISRAPNIFLFLFLFVLKGIFFGALLVCPMSMIGFYFKKRRSFASSLATAGMCAAFIIFPPLTEGLREQYGMRGSLLIFAAIELNLVACSLLLRPVESYKIIYKRKKMREEIEMRELSPIYKGASQFSAQPEDNVKDNGRLLSEEDETDRFVEDGDELNRIRTKSDASSRGLNVGDRSSSDVRYSLNGSPAQQSHLEDLEMALFHSKEDIDRNKKECRRKNSFERQTSHLSAISMTELPYIAPALVEEEELNELNESKKKRQSLCSRLLNIFVDVSLFKIWTFRMMAVFIPLSVFANYAVIYMPVICSTLKISKTDAAMMMTVSGVMDLVTRIATGFIGDFKFVSKAKLVAFSTFVVGTVCHCTRYFTTYVLFMVYAILVGVFGGIRQNFFSVMLMEYVGVQNMGKAYGLSSTLATLALSANHPVVAALFDVTKGFVIPLHYVGVMVHLGTLVLLFEPVFKKLDEKNAANLKSDQKT